MKPSVGRIVIFRQGDYNLGQAVLEASGFQPEAAGHFTLDDVLEAGKSSKGTSGTRLHAAVITRVWSDVCVNLHVFLDGKQAEFRYSITQSPGFSDELNDHWDWPERVV